MTNCISPSGRSDHHYESVAWFDAQAVEGVRYAVARISLGRRIELARKMREIGRKVEYLSAGDDAREKLEAAVVSAEIDRAYLEWGLAEVAGLSIDGETATPASAIEKGPLKLAAEILARVKAEWSLSGDERKN
ncbi:MAG TPA: hypothetical protein VGR73_01880 [Bryobacteraceae bacterium]|nr:hypothetical protein [Bryobacteraceae bacterium]